MTNKVPSIKEMRAYIKVYCQGNPYRLCNECPINNLPEHKFGNCYHPFCTDEEITMNYKAIRKQSGFEVEE